MGSEPRGLTKLVLGKIRNRFMKNKWYWLSLWYAGSSFYKSWNPKLKNDFWKWNCKLLESSLRYANSSLHKFKLQGIWGSKTVCMLDLIWLDCRKTTDFQSNPSLNHIQNVACHQLFYCLVTNQAALYQIVLVLISFYCWYTTNESNEKLNTRLNSVI